MKRTLFPVILTLCAVLSPACLLLAEEPSAAAPSTQAHPKAVFAEVIKDVGRVGKGEKIAHDFVIKNAGDAPLEITDVKPTCGCTVAEFDHTIPPGGTGKIHAVVDTTDFGGPISKTIYVYTNDPDNARVELAVKAEVQPYVFVLPGFARFIQPQGSEPGSVEEIMFTGSFDDLEITKAESPYPFMTVTYRPAREEERREQGQGKQWVLTFTVDYKKTPIGTIADFVTVYTNHPKQPIVRIPVSGFVRPMIAVTPPEADFGEIDLSTPQEARLIVRSFDPAGIQVTSAETDVPGVRVEVTSIEEGKRFALNVTFTPAMAKGDFSGTITLRTTSAITPVVEVPLRGTAI
jgi:Protein of unknown function (DUF1573)